VACRVKDPGEGFSLEELYQSAVSNPPDQPTQHVVYREAAGLPPGGYGILLARHMVDELIYGERGNDVLLIKYLAPPQQLLEVADAKVANDFPLTSPRSPAPPRSS